MTAHRDRPPRTTTIFQRRTLTFTSATRSVHMSLNSLASSWVPARHGRSDAGTAVRQIHVADPGQHRLVHQQSDGPAGIGTRFHASSGSASTAVVRPSRATTSSTLGLSISPQTVARAGPCRTKPTIRIRTWPTGSGWVLPGQRPLGEAAVQPGGWCTCTTTPGRRSDGTGVYPRRRPCAAPVRSRRRRRRISFLRAGRHRCAPESLSGSRASRCRVCPLASISHGSGRARIGGAMWSFSYWADVDPALVLPASDQRGGQEGVDDGQRLCGVHAATDADQLGVVVLAGRRAVSTSVQAHRARTCWQRSVRRCPSRRARCRGSPGPRRS